MKKETEQLIHYLPYKLQCVIVSDKTNDFMYEDFVDDINIFKPNTVWELIGFNNSKDLNIPLGEGELEGFLYKHGTTYVNFHRGILPILRPLSDLTKEIDIDGYFIPAKHLFHDYRKSLELNLIMDSDVLVDLRLEYPNSHGDYIQESEVGLYTWQRLFEWHFDVFGLIEKGLAVDINTLK